MISVRSLDTPEAVQEALDAIFGADEGVDSGLVSDGQRVDLKRRRKASGTKRIAHFESRVSFDQPLGDIVGVACGGSMGWRDALGEGSALSATCADVPGVRVRVHDVDDDDRIVFAWRDGADDAEVRVVPGVEIRRKRAALRLVSRAPDGWREAKRVKRGGWRVGRQRRARVKRG